MRIGESNERGYAGLPCKSFPAAQPGTIGQPELLVKKIKSYSPLAQPIEVVESLPVGGASNTRTTVTTYDNAGREITHTIEGGGTPLWPEQTVYSTTSGMPNERKFTCEPKCGETDIDDQGVVTTYDKLGRPKENLDADGNLSKITYDLMGQPATASDGKGVQAFGYDGTAGLLTKLEDSAAGIFTAAYDADGDLIEEGLPGGCSESDVQRGRRTRQTELHQDELPRMHVARRK